MNSHAVFIHIHQSCFAGTGAIGRLPQCQWSKPDGYGKISQCITITKHRKAKTVCIFLGIYRKQHCEHFVYSIQYDLHFGVWDHRYLDVLFNRLFTLAIKELSKLRINGRWGKGVLVTGWLTPQTFNSWWRHQMETFSTLLAICVGNSPVTGEIPGQRPVTRSFDVFFDLRLNKRLSKQSWAGDLRRHRTHYRVSVMYT